MLFPIIISCVFAIVFAILLPALFRRDGPGPFRGMVFYFLIIFLFTWAIGSWVTPVGPVAFNTSWLGYLIIAFFIMILIGVLVPPRSNKAIPNESEKVPTHKYTRDNNTGITFGVFFWALIIILLAAGIINILLV
ncbi:MAG: hypothetical protein R6V32_08420 [Bacteroidales bacterium]